ncbi:MAG: phage portal protein, partial [Pseudomonadota bacterium]
MDTLKGTVGILPEPAKNLAVESSDVVRGKEVGEAFGLYGPANLPAVTEQSAMQISAVWACTNLIAGAISTLPLNTYAQSKNGEKQLLLDHPYELMFNQEFCPRWSASAGWSYSGQSRLLHGDVFIEIRRKPGFNSNEVDCLIPIHPNRVEVAVWNDGSRLVYIIKPESNLPNGQVRMLDQDDVLHVPGFGFDGCRSLSPLQHALRNTGAVTLAAQNYSAQFFANQARPDYALVAPHEAKFTQEQIDDLREQINERHAARHGQAGKPMLLTGGLKVESITLTNDDAEL